MLGWAESIAVWLLGLPLGQKRWIVVAMAIHLVPILVAASFAASMHAWMDPRDPVKWWRKLPVETFRDVLLASRRRAIVASFAIAAWSLPLAPMVAVEHASWTAPRAIAAYERSVEAGETFDDAQDREVETSEDRWVRRGRIYHWVVLGFAIAAAIGFEAFLWVAYLRHATKVQARLASDEGST